jgi:hypothetical protein
VSALTYAPTNQEIRETLAHEATLSDDKRFEGFTLIAIPHPSCVVRRLDGVGCAVDRFIVG